MKVLVPEIAAHVSEGGEGRNQEILSTDVHPTLPLLASAGTGENRVILWTIRSDNADTGTENWLSFSSEFTSMSFENTVNIVRFSPCGKFLACGDSNGLITIMSVRESNISWMDTKEERDFRRVHLRGHMMDVQDFAWSPNSLFAASAAMDNLVIVWDILKCTEVQRLKGHTHYVQGVSWSPDGQFIASASFDETVHVYKATFKLKTLHVEETAVLKKPRLFADEMRAPTFSRRLAFSPEKWSRVLVVPGGLTRDGSTALPEATGGVSEKDTTEGKRQPTHAAHIFRFSSSMLANHMPVASLTGFPSATLAVRFHPRPFKLVESGTRSFLECMSPVASGASEDTRFVYAVATVTSIFIYDTQHTHPIAMVDKLHYASYTDLAWHVFENGASALIGSSRDGCFTVIRFEPNELGQMITMIPEEPVTSKPEREGVTSAGEAEVKDQVAPSSNAEEKENILIEKIESAVPSAEALTPAKPSAVIDLIDESSSSSSSRKKRRIHLETISTASPSTSSVESMKEHKPAVTILQPRRIKLETFK